MKQLEIHRWVRSIFCIALFLFWIPFLQAQEKRLIDLELNEVPLSTALRQLEREGGKNILFVNDEVEAYRVTVRIQKQPLAEAIQLVLKDISGERLSTKKGNLFRMPMYWSYKPEILPL